MSKKTSPKNSEMPSTTGVEPTSAEDSSGLATDRRDVTIRQRTLLVKNLRTGTIYRDALSGYLVLVQQRESTGPDPKDVRRMLKSSQRVGYYFNPLFGAHQTMELHDHQFINANNAFGYGVPL